MNALISAAQVAELLGISVASARQRLWRAGLREQRGYDPAEVAERFGVVIRTGRGAEKMRQGGPTDA